MIIQRLNNFPINSNCFVVYTSKSENCIVIDPGSENCNELLDFFELKHLKPQFLFLTHEHFDHIWGVNRLKELFNPDLICSETCSEAIINKKKNMSLFYNQIGFETLPADRSVESMGCQMNCNGLPIEFILTKGHSLGSICIRIGNNLFTGDTIIKNLKTVTKLPGGNDVELKESINLLNSKFKTLNPLVYPGHGDCFLFNDYMSELFL